MAPLKEKDANIQTAPKGSAKSKTSSPNTSRKRKSDVEKEDAPVDAQAPASKRAKKSPTGAQSKDARGKAAAKPKTKASPKKDDDKEKYNVDDIHLDGEDDNAVPVYDTCNDVRAKINAHLRAVPKASQTKLVQEINKCFGEDSKPDSGLAPGSLRTFLKKKGPNSGASMPMFYGAYVYFEKLRVKQNKKKSKKREEMEGVWGKKGMDLKVDGDARITMLGGERLSVDKYGQMDIVQR